MEGIIVKDLTRDFEYYEKDAGMKSSVKNLFHRTRRVRHAVKNISFEISKGEIVGFLGPNGAGKTTTIKILSGILHPTSGEVFVNGYVPWERKKEFLKVQVRRLSLGERMKMEMIAALLHRPKVILLDEPTIGLDFIAQNNIRDFLKDYNRKNGAMMLLTSHYLKDIEELCQRTMVISHGDLVYDGTLEHIQDIFSRKRVLNIRWNSPVEKEALDPLGLVKEWEPMKAAVEIDAAAVAETIHRLFELFSVGDIGIDAAPLDEGIAHLYSV